MNHTNTEKTFFENENTIPREIFNLFFLFAYGHSVDNVNFYIGQTIMRSKFAPIPPSLNRITQNNFFLWRHILDGDFHYCIQKFMCWKSTAELMRCLNWTAMKYSPCRPIRVFAEGNQRLDIIERLLKKNTRELVLWKIYRILACLRQRDFKKHDFWKYISFQFSSVHSEMPLSSFVDPPSIFSLRRFDG